MYIGGKGEEGAGNFRTKVPKPCVSRYRGRPVPEGRVSEFEGHRLKGIGPKFRVRFTGVGLSQLLSIMKGVLY
jgi:hypothetical protein